MSLKDAIGENEIIKWGVNTFMKVAFVLFLVGGAALFLEKLFGFTFDISAGLGL